MIIDLKGETYELPDYNLNYLDIRSLDIKLREETPQDILDNILKDLDCTKEFSCGRPMVTTFIMYARHVNAYLYVLDSIDNTNIDDLEIKLRNKNIIDDYLPKLIARHQANIEFEEKNPYIEPKPIPKQRKGKIAKYKTKDLITGEDAYLLEDTKTKRHVVRKNANALDKVKKPKVQFDMSVATFNFNKKDE